MKIKVKTKFPSGNSKLPVVIKKGDWVDIAITEDVYIEGPEATMLKRDRKAGKEEGNGKRAVHFNNRLINLNIAMQLPRGYEAHILPRSSTYNRYGVILANSQGIIDSSYCGDNDMWKFNAIALRDTGIPSGTKLCQFRIALSQKATFWQKLKWLFTSSISFKEVDTLGNRDRGGFGSTDK